MAGAVGSSAVRAMPALPDAPTPHVAVDGAPTAQFHVPAFHRDAPAGTSYAASRSDPFAPLPEAPDEVRGLIKGFGWAGRTALHFIDIQPVGGQPETSDRPQRGIYDPYKMVPKNLRPRDYRDPNDMGTVILKW